MSGVYLRNPLDAPEIHWPKMVTLTSTCLKAAWTILLLFWFVFVFARFQLNPTDLLGAHAAAGRNCLKSGSADCQL